MRLNEGLHSLGKQLDIHVPGKTGNDWRVVYGGFGVLDRIHINAHLSIRQRNVAHVGMCRLCFLLFCNTSTHQCSQNLVFDALHTARLGQSLGIEGNTKAFVNLDGQLDGHDGGKANIAQYRRYTKVLGINDLCDDAVDFLLQHIHRHVGLHNFFHFLFRFRKGFLVHFLVLVERNAVDLHRHGRHHIRWLLVEDKIVQSVDVHLLVADDIGRDEFAASFLVERLHRSILDVRELTDDSLHFLQFDAEAADFHLTVLTSHKLNIARGQITYDVAGTVDTGVLGTIITRDKRVGDKHLSGFLRAVQITSAYLRTTGPQLTGSAYGQTMTFGIDNIEAHVINGLADRNILHFPVNLIAGFKDCRFRWSVGVMHLIALWRYERCQFLTTSREVLQ